MVKLVVLKDGFTQELEGLTPKRVVENLLSEGLWVLGQGGVQYQIRIHLEKISMVGVLALPFVLVAYQLGSLSPGKWEVHYENGQWVAKKKSE